MKWSARTFTRGFLIQNLLTENSNSKFRLLFTFYSISLDDKISLFILRS